MNDGAKELLLDSCSPARTCDCGRREVAGQPLQSLAFFLAFAPPSSFPLIFNQPLWRTAAITTYKTSLGLCSSNLLSIACLSNQRSLKTSQLINPDLELNTFGGLVLYQPARLAPTQAIQAFDSWNQKEIKVEEWCCIRLLDLVTATFLDCSAAITFWFGFRPLIRGIRRKQWATKLE
ncbi:hypothetical protein SCA6_018465 [Theobroma cacao]